MMKKSLSTLASMCALSGTMGGIRGAVVEMVGGRGCGLIERLNISIVVKSLFSYRTKDSFYVTIQRFQTLIIQE